MPWHASRVQGSLMWLRFFSLLLIFTAGCLDHVSNHVRHLMQGNLPSVSALRPGV